ncbi:ALDH-like protein [Athelia psychrophila]|uniref:ALDH-like protein n=1 Tax=Athelia psychrophila TaxID=1759441 RepID=A0A166VAY4_9AGAM|nr:ALDH-like protein [Fibularhizoctonia sp. CBS 109695]
MVMFISAVLHPLKTINLWLENSPDASVADVTSLVTIFLALGVYLVINRYHKAVNSAVPFKWTTPPAADPKWETITIHDANLESHLVHDDLLPMNPAEGRRYITSFDPSTSMHLGTFAADSEADIDAKIERAGRAQVKWAQTTFGERRRVIRTLMKWLVDNQDVAARVACRDTGKTLVDAALGEIITTCSKMEWLMNHGEQALQPETRHWNLILAYKKSKVYYEPLGVVAAIVSWNYPLHNAWSPILASIFAGNAVVLKCSEHVIWSTSWFVGAIEECLRKCGHNPDIVQTVCCWPEQAKALTQSPFIKHITFIGSEKVGRQIAADAIKHLTPVCLELGGKDPAIILPETDLRKWASLWMRGIFQNSGQNCIGIERLIVHESQYDELYAIMTERVRRLRFGSVLTTSDEGFIPTIDCGSMISNQRFKTLQDLVQDAEEKGANVEFGGQEWRHPYHSGGSYFSATVVGDATEEMDIAQEELFAPIATIMRYQTVDEAIDIANGTRYGLGASVFGPTQSQCLTVAKNLECGMVSINDFGVFYLNQDLPFGGVKCSGYGRFGGPEGLRSLTLTKVIMVDRWPQIIQTSIPAVLDYPIRSMVQSWDFVSGLVDFLYADGYRKRFNGLIQLWGASSARK